MLVTSAGTASYHSPLQHALKPQGGDKSLNGLVETKMEGTKK